MTSPKSASGWITIRATDEDNPCIYKEADVFIGCQDCSDGQCDNLAAGGGVRIGSIDIEINLGPGQGGAAAGQMFIHSDKPDATLTTPNGLFLSTTTKDIQPRYDANHMLRQVMAPEALADIRTLDPYAYTINFYRPEDISGEAGGFYILSGGAIPFAVWRIENPDRNAGFTRLKVTQTRDGKTREHLYSWDAEIGDWTLSKANGAQLLSRTEEKSDPERIVTETIKDPHNNIATKTRTTYRKFAWGEEIVQTVTDPDGAALTTTSDYYTDPAQTGSHGKLKSQTNPDGSWFTYEYDDQGSKILEISPFLDSPPGTAAGGARAMAYDYAPVDSADSNDPGDAQRPRTITESILGQTISNRSFRDNPFHSADSTKYQRLER